VLVYATNFIEQRRRILAAGLGVALAGVSSITHSADNRPIKLIVPFGAGSAVDTLARLAIDRTVNHLGIPVVIDNRSGAGGGVGAGAAAQTAPDGTNLFFGTAGTHGINPALYRKLPYDPVKDFDPVIGISSSSNVLLVNPKSGIKSLSDLIARAKANPGVLSMGSTGNGTTPHLSGAVLNRMANIETNHIPYKSSPILDVVAGRLDYCFESVPSAIPFIQSGQAHPVAVTARRREALLPAVPTIEESGYPEYEVMAWVAIFAPRGTPKEFIERFNKAANKALAEPEFIRRLAEIGGTPIGGTPMDLQKRVTVELARWPEIIKAANITID